MLRLYVLLLCKAMAEVTLSTKHQIVIPREARQALGLKPGDKLTVLVRGDQFVIFERPKSYRAAMAGIAAGLYPPGYLEKERESWK